MSKNDTALVWGKDEAEVVEFCQQVVAAFSQLPEAQPLTDDEDYVRRKGYVQKDVVDFEETLGKRGNWDSYDYFGQGAVYLTFEWTNRLPHFEIGLWSKSQPGETEYVPPVPFDTPIKVWQKLMTTLCNEYGYQWQWLKPIIGFENWSGNRELINPIDALSFSEDLFESTAWITRLPQGWAIRQAGYFFCEGEKVDWMPIGHAAYFQSIQEAWQAVKDSGYQVWIEVSLFDFTTDTADTELWKAAHLLVDSKQMVPVVDVWTDLSLWPVRQFRLK